MTAPSRNTLPRSGIHPTTARWQPVVPVTFAVITVLAQIAYPLAPDRWLTRLSVLTVVTFALASVTHAVLHQGGAWAARLVAVVLAVALAAEILGVGTGVPFGRYSYTHTLGPEVAGVPLLVPLAWLMMAYPCLLMARVLTARLRIPDPARVLLVGVTGGAALAAWDVFLDPQMVAAHHWAWAHPSPGLPGVAAVPVTNLVGWLVVGTVVLTVCEAVLARPKPDLAGRHEASPVAAQAVPAALLAWTWLGSTLGNLAFFGRPWVGLWGFGLLGIFVAPYLLLVMRGTRPR
jgi:uncharacterized membrane protein